MFPIYLPWLAVPLVSLVLTWFAVVATSIYFHRAMTHRSLQIHPVADIAFRLFLCVTTGQKRQQWVAVHLKHHAFTDRKGDPHSPRLFGFWRVQFLNAYYYAREAGNPETIRKYAQNVPQDFLDRHVFIYGWAWVTIGIALAIFVFGWPGLLMAVLHGLLYVFVAAPLINALGHWRGKKNYPNSAYNWPWLSWLTGGESLHNNHHAFPRAPKFSIQPGESDSSWPIICALVAVRMAQVLGHLVMPDDKPVVQVE